MRSSFKVGIVISVIAIVTGLVMFTNIDEMTYPNIENAISQVKVDDSTIRKVTNNYPLDTKCDYFLAVYDNKFGDEKWMIEQLGQEKYNQLKTKYRQEVEDFYNNLGVHDCHGANSPSACFQQVRNLQEKQLSEIEDMMINPKVLDEVRNAKKSQEDYVALFKKTLEDPECIKKVQEK